jgi:hypothetical protein
MLLFKTATPVDYLFVAKHKKDYYVAFLQSTEKTVAPFTRGLAYF